MFDWIVQPLENFLRDFGPYVAIFTIPAGLIAFNPKGVFRFVLNIRLPPPEGKVGAPVQPPPQTLLVRIDPSDVAIKQARNALEMDGFLIRDPDYPYVRQARELREENVVTLMKRVSGPQDAARVAIIREYENALPMAA